MALLIGISGKARSGKDTVASMIEERLPGIHRTNFSTALREEYDAHHGTRTLHDEEEKDRHRLGIAAWAERRRAEDPHYWTTRALTHEGDTLVAGVRAVSEAEGIKERGGMLIRVEVSDEVMRKRMGEHYHHADTPNEKHLDDYVGWDFVVTNDGTLEELRKQVEVVVKQLA